MSGLLLAGDVYFDRFDDTGNPTGLIGPLNATQLQINTPSETKDRESKKKDSYGQALDSVTIAKPSEIAIAFDDQPAEMLAMAMMGDTAPIHQGADTVSDAPITVLKAGLWTKLPHSNIAAEGLSAVLASDDSAIAATAYEVNYAAGLIRATAGGALAAGDDIKLSYEYAAISGSRISGGVRPTINARIFLDGTNLATGKPVKCEIPKASLAPSAAVDLLASEYVSTTLGGKLILKTGEAAPFYLDQES
ncbi:hypothetical protein Q4508_12585 [Amphritea sp. 2_MG-2023]|uniref:phage tail tube protein n=1 Tax=Amphritea TaxID=515417 RepID=UPI001C0776D0|nr:MULTISPECIES: hypothetical protein [Amphritea]MBU2967059.1 hypothetical protein [Amphritea atlantica]MDO6419388.1 hypothetical protein [Amphritea sp. 2_MG-2023]